MNNGQRFKLAVDPFRKANYHVVAKRVKFSGKVAVRLTLYMGRGLEANKAGKTPLGIDFALPTVRPSVILHLYDSALYMIRLYRYPRCSMYVHAVLTRLCAMHPAL